jgi:anti-anti-sigma factor
LLGRRPLGASYPFAAGLDYLTAEEDVPRALFARDANPQLRARQSPIENPRSRSDSRVDVYGFRAAVEPDGHVYLSGELDITALDAFREALHQALIDSTDLLLVDVGGLSFVDSRATCELLRYQIAAANRHRRLCLEAVPEQVANVFEILDLGHILMTATDTKCPRLNEMADVGLIDEP